MGVHRYNHNLETARSYFPQVVTTHTWEERWETLRMVRDAGMEVCCGGIVGMGETLEQRAEFAANSRSSSPHEVPLNFLNPRPGTPFGDLTLLPASDALRAVAAFRLALPRTILRFAGGREITLGDLGARAGPARRHQRGHRRQLPDDAGPPAEADLDLLANCRCRSRRSTRPSSCGLSDEAGQVQRLHWRTRRRRGAHRGPTRSRATTVLRRVRAADGGASASRRVVGQVLAPRRTGLERTLTSDERHTRSADNSDQ